MTTTTKMVLGMFLLFPVDDLAEQEWHGYEIAEGLQLSTGTVYPILARLEDHGWLESRWETGPPTLRGAHQRRYYRLTDTGRTAAQQALNR